MSFKRKRTPPTHHLDPIPYPQSTHPTVAISSGSFLLTLSKNAALIHETPIGSSRTLPLRHSLHHPSTLTSASLTPDGTRLVTGCSDGAIRLWNLSTRPHYTTLLRPNFDAHPSVLVAISPSAQYILAAHCKPIASVPTTQLYLRVDDLSESLLVPGTARKIAVANDGSVAISVTYLSSAKLLLFRGDSHTSFRIPVDAVQFWDLDHDGLTLLVPSRRRDASYIQGYFLRGYQWVPTPPLPFPNLCAVRLVENGSFAIAVSSLHGSCDLLVYAVSDAATVLSLPRVFKGVFLDVTFSRRPGGSAGPNGRKMRIVWRTLSDRIQSSDDPMLRFSNFWFSLQVNSNQQRPSRTGHRRTPVSFRRVDGVGDGTDRGDVDGGGRERERERGAMTARGRPFAARRDEDDGARRPDLRKVAMDHGSNVGERRRGYDHGIVKHPEKILNTRNCEVEKDHAEKGDNVHVDTGCTIQDDAGEDKEDCERLKTEQKEVMDDNVHVDTDRKMNGEGDCKAEHENLQSGEDDIVKDNVHIDTNGATTKDREASESLKEAQNEVLKSNVHIENDCKEQDGGGERKEDCNDVKEMKMEEMLERREDSKEAKKDNMHIDDTDRISKDGEEKSKKIDEGLPRKRKLDDHDSKSDKAESEGDTEKNPHDRPQDSNDSLNGLQYPFESAACPVPARERWVRESVKDKDKPEMKKQKGVTEKGIAIVDLNQGDGTVEEKEMEIEKRSGENDGKVGENDVGKSKSEEKNGSTEDVVMIEDEKNEYVETARRIFRHEVSTRDLDSLSNSIVFRSMCRMIGSGVAWIGEREIAKLAYTRGGKGNCFKEGMFVELFKELCVEVRKVRMARWKALYSEAGGREDDVLIFHAMDIVLGELKGRGVGQKSAVGRESLEDVLQDVAGGFVMNGIAFVKAAERLYCEHFRIGEVDVVSLK